MRKSKMLILAAMIVTLSTSTTSYAEYYCSGVPSRVAVAQNGRVSIISTQIFPEGQGRDVCNLYTPFKGVQTAACRGWLAMLMTAQLVKKSVRICYTDTYSCSTQPAWDSASAPWAIDAE